jgi:hypothetical protein
MKNMIFIAFLLFTVTVNAADLRSLKNLFNDNFDSFYVPRMCGKNIERFVKEAAKRNIDLSNSYILKVEGSGFLETSGFYTRSEPNERTMLGYFHFIFVADGYVFDFDLAEPLVLKMEDYVRLQFTPPYDPYVVYGITINPIKDLTYWTATHYEWKNYISSNPVKTWEKSFGEIINLQSMMKKTRVR